MYIMALFSCYKRFIDLKLMKEENIVSLIGAYGAGKTTTLHSIQGLLKAASGNVTIYG